MYIFAENNTPAWVLNWAVILKEASGLNESISLSLSTISLTATTYPNPTSDYVVLAISDINLTDLSYALYDIQGKPIARAIISLKDTQIDMHSLSAGTYLLNVNQNNQKLKSFKIIKK